ncbi:MAG: hybrid sensor histidine kinase/response regulator [Bacteroidales bacterium]|nr:hybrid sensor histidine kinase/response regulator [Bacteroidales bacterium]
MNEKEETFKGFGNQPPPLILIVDDLPENLAVLGNILRNEGYQIAVANNGQQAVKIAASRKPDLVLLDVAMPEMDGLIASRLMKENPESENIPVIFLTARTDSSDVLKGFEAGAVDYIAKPFKSAELLARVATHIELKQSRDLIFRQKTELTQLLATKDKLFSIISHDLRSPFAGLLTMINIMVEEFDSYEKEELRVSMKLIRDTSDHMHTLIQNLLNWAKLQNSTLEYKPLKIHLKEEVRKSTDVLAMNSVKKGIQFSSSISDSVYIAADPDMLRIIFHNLLGNAIKFSHSGGTIQISCTTDQDLITLGITDMGVGMTQSQTENLFKPGNYISTSGTANEPGSGLGLILCKEMIEKMGGKIGVESEYGTGSTFWFSLPAG